MGFGLRGLPLGLSIIGDLFAENTLLQIGMAYQREMAWHTMRPPVLDEDGGRGEQGAARASLTAQLSV